MRFVLSFPVESRGKLRRREGGKEEVDGKERGMGVLCTYIPPG